MVLFCGFLISSMFGRVRLSDITSPYHSGPFPSIFIVLLLIIRIVSSLMMNQPLSAITTASVDPLVYMIFNSVGYTIVA